MKKKFLCPHCGGVLNPNNKIIHVTITSNGKRGLVLQSEEFGDYNYITDPSFVFEPNEKLTHLCPLCQNNLQSQIIPECSELIVLEENKKGRIFFANDNGKHATFIHWEHGKEESFGEHRQSIFAGFSLHPLNYEDNNIARMQ